MSKVITFSRNFPKSHPKAGQPTHFVEKIWESIYLQGNAGWEGFADIVAVFPGLYSHGTHEPKHHTIRAGNRWKVGDIFSPRVWGNDINPKSGRTGAYQSKQIQFAPDIEIKKIWTFRISYNSYYVDEQEFLLDDLTTLAKNDGLVVQDFEDWFSIHPKKGESDFIGQILCWNESIEYP